jgi:CO dehydrogenase maturation factor
MVQFKGTIVVTGRGGTGKSTFTTFMSRYLGSKGIEPLLLVDSDPDQSLAEMLGIDLESVGKKSVADVLSEILVERKMTRMTGMTPTDKIEPYLFQETLYEGRDYFDFLSVGTKWIEGCYCLPDRSLGQIMERWATNYEYIIVDSPAGVEHLNRRITKKVKDVFNILDPSKKSFDNAKRSHKIMKEVDIEFDNYYLVGGYRFPEQLEKEGENQPFPFLGRIEHDEQVTNYNLEGRSLLELPEESPAYQSVKAIMEKVGY